MSWRQLTIAALAAVWVAGLAGTAGAQERPERPFRRIFGQERARTAGSQQLDVTFSFLQAYDDNVLGDQLSSGEPRFQESGTYPSASVDLRYTRRVRRMTLIGTAGSALQYYSQMDGTLDRSHNASIDLNIPVSSRTNVRLGQTASYATFYTLVGLPGNVFAENADLPATGLLQAGPQFGVSSEAGWEYHTAAGIARELGRRGSLEGRYGFARTDLPSTTAVHQEAGFTYNHTVNRHASLVMGYGYETGGDTSAAEPVVFHDIDIGVSYRRSLPRARNTSIAFATGSAVVVREGARDYRLVADARLTHMMGRSWAASLAYDRGIDFMAVLSRLVASDAVIGGLSGFLNPALETSVSGSYSRGTVGHLGPGGGRLITYSGAARIQYALSRNVAIDARYLYYFYEFGEGVALPAHLGSGLSRQGVRLGLTVWLPLVR